MVTDQTPPVRRTPVRRLRARRVTTALAIVATLAASVCALGWWWEANSGSLHRITSCTVAGGTVTFGFWHGSGEHVEVERIPRGNGDQTILVRLHGRSGPSTAQGVLGSVSLDHYGGRLLDHRGDEIACTPSQGSANAQMQP